MIKIKPFTTKANIDQIFEFLERVAGKGFYSKEEIRQIPKFSTKNRLNASFLAFDGNKLVGVRITYTSGKKWYWELESKFSDEINILELSSKLAYFKSIFLDPEYRRKGLGGRLAEKSIAVLRKHQVEAIVTHSATNSAHGSSKKYLEKLGFTPIKRWKHFWSEIEYECTDCYNKPGTKCTCDAIEMIKYL